MTTTMGITRRSVRVAIVALVAGFLALGALFVPGGPARGDEAPGAEVSGATLSWRLSEYVFTNPASFGIRTAEAPATIDANAWQFTGGTGTYDPSTGEVSVAFEGRMNFGNTAAGNYEIQFDDPSFVVDAGGAGRLLADVYVRGPGSAPLTLKGSDVVVSTFTASTLALGGHVQLTVTPDFPARPDPSPTATYTQGQFPQTLLDAVGSSFAAHFRQTGAVTPSANDLLKPPAPITLAFWMPGVGVTPTTDIPFEGGTVTVSGSGIDPDANVYADGPLVGEPAGIEVAFGRFAEVWQPSASASDETREVLASKHVVPAATRTLLEGLGVPSSSLATLNADGTFETTLDIEPGGSSAGADAVATYAAGGIANASHEFLTPVTFAAAVTTTTAPPPTTTLPGDPPGGDEVVDGGLDWGLKASFRNYIQTTAAGTITPGNGATTNGDGTFHFPLDVNGDEYVEGDVTAAFDGSVHFTGHSGALDLTVSDLRVVTTGSTGVLVADLVNAPVGDAPETFDDVELVALDLSGSGPIVVGTSLRWDDIVASLTADGAEAFAGFYTTGTAFDTADLVLDFESVPDGAGGSGPVAGLDKTSVRPGDRLTVNATGYTPGEQAEVWVHSDPVLVGSTTAGTDGSVVYTFTVPDLPPGEHRVEIRGITSGRSVFSATFTVVGGSGTSPLAFTGANRATTDLVLAGSGLILLGGGALVAAARQRRRTLQLPA